eukprot:scaffold9178_cov176-Amphora_coffeaeformis.AAC.11
MDTLIPSAHESSTSQNQSVSQQRKLAPRGDDNNQHLSHIDLLFDAATEPRKEPPLESLKPSCLSLS